MELTVDPRIVVPWFAFRLVAVQAREAILGDSLNPPQRPHSGPRPHFNSRCLRCRTIWGNIVLLWMKQVGIKFMCIYRVSLKI